MMKKYPGSTISVRLDGQQKRCCFPTATDLCYSSSILLRYLENRETADVNSSLEAETATIACCSLIFDADCSYRRAAVICSSVSRHLLSTTAFLLRISSGEAAALVSTICWSERYQSCFRSSRSAPTAIPLLPNGHIKAVALQV